MNVDGDTYAFIYEPHKESHMTITQVKAFYADFTNELQMAKFPEDFADWLMDEGREADAREFLFTIRHWQEVTPRWNQTIPKMVEIAETFAPVVDFSEEIRAPHRTSFTDALALLRDVESVDEPDSDDPPLPWDREAAIVNRMIADEALLAEADQLLLDDEEDWTLQEYPDVEVYVDDDDSIVSIALKTFYTLVKEGFEEGGRAFLTEVRPLILRLDYEKIFWIIWTYVTVLPEPGSRISRSWRN